MLLVTGTYFFKVFSRKYFPGTTCNFLLIIYIFKICLKTTNNAYNKNDSYIVKWNTFMYLTSLSNNQSLMISLLDETQWCIVYGAESLYQCIFIMINHICLSHWQTCTQDAVDFLHSLTSEHIHKYHIRNKCI